MQKRFTHNLDLFLFSLLNLIFFLLFHHIFDNPDSFYSQNFCHDLPHSANFIEYSHLVFFVIFFLSFVFKSCLLTIENQEKLLTKALSCLMNMSLFSSFFVYVGMYFNLFYVYFHSSNDCMSLGNLVLSDIIVSSICYTILILYRLCFKALFKNSNYEAAFDREQSIQNSRIKSGIRMNGSKYGTMREHDEERFSEEEE